MFLTEHLQQGAGRVLSRLSAALGREEFHCSRIGRERCPFPAHPVQCDAVIEERLEMISLQLHGAPEGFEPQLVVAESVGDEFSLVHEVPRIVRELIVKAVKFLQDELDLSRVSVTAKPVDLAREPLVAFRHGRDVVHVRGCVLDPARIALLRALVELGKEVGPHLIPLLLGRVPGREEVEQVLDARPLDAGVAHLVPDPEEALRDDVDGLLL